MKNNKSLYEVFDLQIRALRKKGKYATARNYQRCMESVRSFMQGQELSITHISTIWVEKYNDYLCERGISRNSVSFYNRILRAVYNKYCGSVRRDPFRNVYTGVAPTRKRALSPTVLRRIAQLELEGEMALSRDLFLFSFFARGMCFVDIAKLRKSNIVDNMICYERSKTGQMLVVQMEPCMEEIIRRWSPSAYGEYVFPLLHSRTPESAFEEYTYRIARHNLILKEIGKRARAPFPLSSYAARHSWATIAQSNDIPVSIISSGLGHTTERTTRIYLSELEHSVLDRANRKVIKSVLR